MLEKNWVQWVLACVLVGLAVNAVIFREPLKVWLSRAMGQAPLFAEPLEDSPAVAAARRQRTLDAKAACVLAEYALLDTHLYVKAKCDRAELRHLNPRMALLRGVEAESRNLPGNWFTTDSCLVRGALGWAAVPIRSECDHALPDEHPTLDAERRQALLKTATGALWNAFQAPDRPIAPRGAAQEATEDCGPLEPANSRQVGFEDFTHALRGPHDETFTGLELTSTVLRTCETRSVSASAGTPWDVALGGCGLDEPWKYVIAFSDVASTPPGHGPGPEPGTMRLSINVVDVARQRVLCARPVQFALDGGLSDPDALSRFRTGAHAAICAELKTLTKGAIVPGAPLHCGPDDNAF